MSASLIASSIMSSVASSATATICSFLLTKWDALHNPGRADGHFSNAFLGRNRLGGNRALALHFRQQFSSLKGPRRALTPYSAGWINADGMFVRDDKYQAIFDKFNRTLWNWLFGNVTAAHSSESPPVRETLYEDVSPQRPKAPSFYQALIKTILWI